MRVRDLVAGVVAVGCAALGLASPAHAASASANSAVVTNDPGFAYQWGVKQTRVDQAWETVRGSGRVTIAVVDSGVTPSADLAGRLLPGHNFVGGNDDTSDDLGHGSLAAEVVAGAGNNRTGVAGVCWSCKILPVKVLDSTGAGSYENIAAGIRYAADRGAQIINLSLSGTEDSDVLRDAVAYASGKGSLVVAAAGNDGTSAPHFPAAIPSVLSVGGVTQSDARYSWSEYGNWVTVTAPGCNPSVDTHGKLEEYCGTSSAAPFVAGVAGLLASTDPAPTAAQIRAALIASRNASGRIDAMKALAALPYAGDKTKPSVAFAARQAAGRRVSVTATASDQHGVAKVQLFANGKLVAMDTSFPYAFSFTAAAKGTVTLQLRAYDRAGNVATTTRAVQV